MYRSVYANIPMWRIGILFPHISLLSELLVDYSVSTGNRSYCLKTAISICCAASTRLSAESQNRLLLGFPVSTHRHLVSGFPSVIPDSAHSFHSEYSVKFLP